MATPPTVDPSSLAPGELIGSDVRRSEDRALVTGNAAYTADHHPGHAVHLSLVRSPHAHAGVESIDASRAERADDVLGVYTFADLAASGIEGLLPTDSPDDGVSPEHPLLARDAVRFQGEPVAAVVAEDPYAARDAADRVDVTYDRRDAVPDIHAARDPDAPAVHEAAPDNVAFRWGYGDPGAVDDAFAAAAHTVTLDTGNNRVIPSAMEPRNALAEYRPGADRLTVTLSHQKPHSVRRDLAEMLDLPDNKVRVRVPDVGGAFGAKNQPYPEPVLAAWCAMRLDRPVAWQATRGGDIQSTVHGRDHATRLEAALDTDGRIAALRHRVHANVGAYLTWAGSGVPSNAGEMITGVYDIPAVDATVTGVFTNTTPLSSYRGAGRPEATYYIERLLHEAARELGLDPADLRRRNFIDPDQFPYETPAGVTYEGGEYAAGLEQALDAVDYDALRERQAALRDEGRYLGIGISTYVDRCGGSDGDYEGGLVRMDPTGTVVAMTGTRDNGHGHATTFAQVVADELGVPFADVDVVEGDTDRTPEGRGTGGSRSTPMGGNALRAAARKVVEQARRLAADELEAAPEDVTFEDGAFQVTGAPARSVHIQDLAGAAYDGDVPAGAEPGLEATAYFTPDGRTFPFGTHVAVVEVDPGTGEVAWERYVAVDDCGVRINPALVEGQLVGGAVQGIGQALLEGAAYDGNGALLTGSFQDYAVPRAMHLPDVETETLEVPTRNNPLGVKGVGESGTIAATPAAANAVADAIGPLGGDDLDMPLAGEAAWRAATGGGD